MKWIIKPWSTIAYNMLSKNPVPPPSPGIGGMTIGSTFVIGTSI